MSQVVQITSHILFPVTPDADALPGPLVVDPLTVVALDAGGLGVVVQALAVPQVVFPLAGIFFASLPKIGSCNIIARFLQS